MNANKSENKFSVGDKVVRTGPSFRDVTTGNIYTVSGIYGVTDIYLQDLPHRAYDTDYFELAEQKEKEMTFKNMKFDVAAIAKQLNVEHEEASRIIQEALFEQGYSWSGTANTSVIMVRKPYLFADAGGKLGWDDDKTFFDKSENGPLTTLKSSYVIVEAEEQQEIVELNGKKYNKQELEKALSLLKPIE